MGEPDGNETDDGDESSLLAISCERHADALVIFLTGEYDLASKGRLSSVTDWTQRGIAAVVVDASELTFMDSTGLADVVALQRATELHGVALTLRGARSNVRQVFEITRLDHLLEP